MGLPDEALEGRGLNLYQVDDALQALLERQLDPAQLVRARPLLERMGELAGGAIDRQAEYTDRYAPPVLEAHDRQGAVVKRVRYNPLYEESVGQVYGLGIVGCSFGPDRLPFAVHHALLYLLSQSDPALGCPVTLTAATAFVLDRHGSPEQRARWLPQLTVRQPGPYLDGATWVTERPGGSDAGAAETLAEPDPAGGWRLTGEKWFASNADADLALVTARPAGAGPGTRGLGLYLVARQGPDGTANRYRIRRLKDKLGTRGLATGEIELEGAAAELVTPPPDGFRHMLEALEFSRIANAAASCGIMRRVTLEAFCYARQRAAFGQVLTDFPMVQETLATMQAQAEAGLLLTFEAVRALDRGAGPAHRPATTWQRLTTALAKYRTGEDAVRNASRAVEVLGGNGYVEDYVTARLFREAQVLPVWEGPANIQALEVLRMLGPRWRAGAEFAARVLGVAEQAGAVGPARDLAGLLRAQAGELEDALSWLAVEPGQGPRHARRLMAWMADLLEVALLLEQALPELARGDHRTLALAWWLAQARLRPLALHGVGDQLSWLPAALPALLAHRPLEAVPLAELGPVGAGR